MLKLCSFSARSIWPATAWVGALVLSLLMGAGTALSAAGKGTVLVLGDSIAAGYGLDPALAFPHLLQSKIDSANLPFNVVNAGVSGDTSAGGLRRIDWQLKRPVDVLLMELGGNDGLRGLSVADMERNLQAIIDKTRARYPSATVVIAGMQMPPNLGADYARAYRSAFETLAQKNHAAIVPFLLEGVGGVEALNQPDRIHPTAQGHKIVAENVWKVLQPILQRIASAKPVPSPSQVAAVTNSVPNSGAIQR